jgi:hypothetical protein
MLDERNVGSALIKKPGDAVNGARAVVVVATGGAS